MYQYDLSAQNPKTTGWYCLRSHPKHEHIAAAHLRNMVGEIDVFCPRLKIKRRCNRGVVWFVEALFPGYLFARFNPDNSMQIVKSVPGVKTVLSFGLMTVIIKDEIIDQLRADFDHNEMHEVPDDLQPGDEVTITTGPLRGLHASVLRLLPVADRVQLLLEMLGRTTTVEVAREYVITQKSTAQLLSSQQSMAAHN
ncbi:MAG: transcription termination/antitermination NusG family protein [Verrucomicrobiota bacterium]